MLTVNSYIQNRLFMALLALLLACVTVSAQKQVTIDRAKLAQDRSRKAAVKRKQKTRRVAPRVVKRKRHSVPKKVEQPYVEPYLWVDNSESVTRTVGHTDGYTTFSINTNEVWSCVDLPSWCKISRKDDQSLTIYVLKNPSCKERNACFFIKSNDRQVRVNIVQQAKPISVTASINNVYVRHNVWIDGVLNMVVTGSLTIKNSDDLNLYALARIYNKQGIFANANKDYSNNADLNGMFCILTKMQYNYDNTYSFKILIPNESYYIGGGVKQKLNLVVGLYCYEMKGFVQNTLKSIEFKRKCNRNGYVITKK